jgi:hypothetical protein
VTYVKDSAELRDALTGCGNDRGVVTFASTVTGLQFSRQPPVLLQGSKAAKSPILEAMDVMLWNYTFQGDLPRRELAIFSDLISHCLMGSIAHAHRFSGKINDEADSNQ